MPRAKYRRTDRYEVLSVPLSHEQTAVVRSRARAAERTISQEVRFALREYFGSLNANSRSGEAAAGKTGEEAPSHVAAG